MTARRLSSSATCLAYRGCSGFKAQKLALPIHEAQHVGDIAGDQLLVEGLGLSIVLGLRAATGQRRCGRVVVEVGQRAGAQFAIEGEPLLMQLAAQRRESFLQRLAYPGNVQLLEGLGLPLGGHQLGAQVSILMAVVEVDLAGVQPLAQLAVHPELVAVGVHAGRLAGRIEDHEVRTQALRHGALGALGERALRQALLRRKDALHPCQRGQPGTREVDAVGLQRLEQWSQVASHARGELVDRFPAEGELTGGPDAQPLPSGFELLARHDLEGAPTHAAEGCRVGDGGVHVQQEQLPKPGRFLLPLQLLLEERLLGPRLGFVLELPGVVARRIDQGVGELAEALPDEAQQVQVRLLGLHAPQLEHGVEVRQTRVVVQVLLRDRELRQQPLRGQIQGPQALALVALASHLPPAEVSRVLLEQREIGQGLVAHQQFRQRCLGRGIKRGGQQRRQTQALCRQRLAHDPLQGRIAWPLHLVGVEVGDELGGNEARRDVAASDLLGLLHEVFGELAGPQAISEQLSDQGTLGVVLVPGDGARLECLAGEVAAGHEGEIGGDVLPGKAEERLLGLEVADLQEAPDLVVQAGAAAGQRELRLGEAQVLKPLRVVEVGQPVQGVLFSRGQHGQQVVLRGHCSSCSSGASAHDQGG